MALEHLLTASMLENLVPFGHYYSLYPDLKEVEARSEEIFFKEKMILDIDLREEEQLSLFKRMGEMFSSLPDWKDMGENTLSQLRYRYGNPTFPPADAVIWHCLLRRIKPSTVIEVGSGWSSAVLLDTNEAYFDNKIQLKFIEPYPERLKSTLRDSDRITLIESGLETVELETFKMLGENDVLFIDGTHVSKVGSDVNYLLFEILPRLNHGVYIHFHDIFYPFEYPKKWIMEGQIWNELYVLRAFLQNNKDYEIVYFQNMVEEKFQREVASLWPLKYPFHGGSIYLKKL